MPSKNAVPPEVRVVQAESGSVMLVGGDQGIDFGEELLTEFSRRRGQELLGYLVREFRPTLLPGQQDILDNWISSYSFDRVPDDARALAGSP